MKIIKSIGRGVGNLRGGKKKLLVGALALSVVVMLLAGSFAFNVGNVKASIIQDGGGAAGQCSSSWIWGTGSQSEALGVDTVDTWGWRYLQLTIQHKYDTYAHKWCNGMRVKADFWRILQCTSGAGTCGATVYIKYYTTDNYANPIYSWNYQNWVPLNGVTANGGYKTTIYSPVYTAPQCGNDVESALSGYVYGYPTARGDISDYCVAW